MSTVLFDPIRTQAKVTDAVLVGFSGGKDSIVTLDLCMRHFKRVQPFFMYYVPGLRMQEETIRRYEKRYGVDVIRIPHFEVSNFMRYGTFRDPDPYVGIVSVKDVYDYLRIKTDIYWIACGERIADSVVRRAMIKRSGSIDKERGRFYPLAYWTKSDVVNYIQHYNLKLGKDYNKLGYSFRSLNANDLTFLNEEYPDDLQRVLRLYPLAMAGIKREEYYGKKQVPKL